jgi:hypothetical protein
MARGRKTGGRSRGTPKKATIERALIGHGGYDAECAVTLYDAFISYSHAEDKPISVALQSMLQKLGKLRYQRRALPVFRDDTSAHAPRLL